MQLSAYQTRDVEKDGMQEFVHSQALQVKHLKVNDTTQHEFISPCAIKSFTVKVSTTGAAILTTVNLVGGLKEEAAVESHQCHLS